MKKFENKKQTTVTKNKKIMDGQTDKVSYKVDVQWL